MFSSERLKGLDVFVAVADLGSFTAAAERLNLTGSAVSKSVARLEERLGVRLFNRTTRTLALTEAGYHLLPHLHLGTGRPGAGRACAERRGRRAPRQGAG